MPNQPLDQLAINTIRTLSMDAVEAAKSGHPGTPMALAPVAYVLWNEVLRYDPAQPGWPNRDRFVLSCGHASMLLYSVLHLAGVKQMDKDGRPTDEPAVPLEDIRRFRQLGSRCPGHPEHGHTSGVETTTGPLGQGIGNSVGMAIASRWLAARYNRPGFDLFDFNVYALCSDGDLMEGVGGEAASPAQGQHPRGPRGAAGRGGNPPDQGRLRLAGEREVSGAARGDGLFPAGHRRQGRQIVR
jgi:transketolase